MYSISSSDLVFLTCKAAWNQDKRQNIDDIRVTKAVVRLCSAHVVACPPYGRFSLTDLASAMTAPATRLDTSGAVSTTRLDGVDRLARKGVPCAKVLMLLGACFTRGCSEVGDATSNMRERCMERVVVCQISADVACPDSPPRHVFKIHM